MNHSFRITTLVENTVNTRGLLAEHGLSFYLEHGRQKILFDAGQSQILLQNARQLGISLQSLDAVVLSHGHYDHSGALKEILALAPRARLYLHPDAVKPKYGRDPNGRARAIGLPHDALDQIKKHPGSIFWTRDITPVGEGVFSTGRIPRMTGFEDTGGSFYLDEACQHPDPLSDDQALFFESRQGIQVILGCAHAGVVNTLQSIQNALEGKIIHTVMGGMHLLNATPERLARTIAALRQLGIQRLAPAHCTGWPATAALWAAFPGQCQTCSTGGQISF